MTDPVEARRVVDPVSKDGYELEFEDTFDGDSLDLTRWLPHYLPQWSSREASAARYEVGGGALRLVIEADQPPWCPSSTARPGSPRCRPGSSPARSAAPSASRASRRGWWSARPRRTPGSTRPSTACSSCARSDRRSPLHGGAVDDRVRGRARPVGGDLHLRDLRPRRGGRPGRRRDGPASLGDPRIRDEFSVEDLAIDARDFHVYAAEWTPGYVAFFVDHQLVKLVEQSPGYPMQFMLDIYEFPEDQPPQPADAYPKQFVVDYFRGYRSTQANSG